MRKKYVIIFTILCCILFLGGIIGEKFFSQYSLKGFFLDNPLEEPIYVNIDNNLDDVEYKKISKLIYNLRDKGIDVKLNKQDDARDENLSLYVASSYHNMPQVRNKNSINILWVPYVSPSDDFEKYRDFDVIVVKSIASFSHLKAINVRTAFIPDGIDIKSNNKKNNGKVMFYGDNKEFSLSLFLSRNLNIDIFGNNWEHTEYKHKIKAKSAKKSDILSYLMVLVDQSDENIHENIVNNKVIEILEMGAVPLLRYNPGIQKMFGDTVPMYYNEDDFYVKFNMLLRENNKVSKIKQDIENVSYKWNSSMVANKFIELFQIMKQKRI
ncbi:MAG: hypothetical protein IKW58_03860 [Alphaproteobacteria bacterium]|nr:hypothetical protein [Alphaproteobacteria bacterium]